MVTDLGRILPRYTEGFGKLKPKVGRCLIDQANRELPVRMVQFTDGRDNLPWEVLKDRLSRGEIKIAPDSALSLNEYYLNYFLRPTDQAPGVLLVKKEQLSQEVLQTMRQMVKAAGKDLDQYSWLVLLPFLEIDGRDAVCFDLPTSGANQQGTNEFLSGITNKDVAKLFQALGGKILFFNPYFASGRFLGSQKS